MPTQKKPFVRLPTAIIPLNYDLTIKPDLTKFTFEGSLIVTIKVNQETEYITLNVNEVVIGKEGLTVKYPDQSKF